MFEMILRSLAFHCRLWQNWAQFFKLLWNITFWDIWDVLWTDVRLWALCVSVGLLCVTLTQSTARGRLHTVILTAQCVCVCVLFLFSL